MSLGNHVLKYHVFLSFRGEDTRFKFTDHLYGALCRAGINTFRDGEELRTGEKIRPALLTAIEDSRISIIVLSRNYASSTWCLDELVKILECRKLMKQVVLPIFYEVNPSEVRKQTGSFGDSMVRHEERYKNNIEKIEKWRSALQNVANLSGESYTNKSEPEFIGEIIQKISSILDYPLLHLPEQTVGLESKKSRVVSLLDIGTNDVDVFMVGIYGTGGVGKTVVAKAVYNLIAAQFESTCFFADVRENTTKYGLAHSQQSILTDMLGKNNINLHNKHRGTAVMEERLQSKRVLLVLDDVDKLKQLQSLAGRCNWFGPGSRVIITTRDKHLLSRHGIEKMYEVKELKKEEALKLLCWNAFRSSEPTRGFEDVSTRVLSYAEGIPLALEIIGSHLFGKDVEEWESAMNAYKKNMDNDIFGILKVSYESLGYNEKEIFLDVACFLRGNKFDYVEDILGGCGFSSKSGLSILEDRCLVKRQDGEVWMHDLTQSMGREIIRQESEREPWERSRVWFHEDALQVLTRDMGTSKILGLMLEFPRQEEVVWNDLPNGLKVFEWENYPSSSLPFNFLGNELLEFKLKNATQIVQLQEPFKVVMDHHYSYKYIIAQASIPSCFRYQSSKSFISFWIQKSFPDVHVCFAVRNRKVVNFSFKLSIGPLKIYHEVKIWEGASTLILLLPRSLSYKDCLEIQEMLMRLDYWVRVDISLVTSPDNPPASTDRNQDLDADVEKCGIYVSPTCDANFSFVDPNSWYSIKNKSFAGRLAENGVVPPTIVKQKDDISSNLLWKKIMSLKVSPQVKHFAWTAISDNLTSKRSLEKKGSHDRCHICGKRNVKMDFHVLKNCQLARGIWLLSPLGLRVDRMQANTLPEWMQNLEQILDTESLELFLVIACGLWRDWNKLCIGLKIEDPPSFIRSMCTLMQDYRITDRPMSQCILTDEDVVPYRPSSQPTCRQAGNQPQKKNGKHNRSMDKGKQAMHDISYSRRLFPGPDKDL